MIYSSSTSSSNSSGHGSSVSTTTSNCSMSNKLTNGLDGALKIISDNSSEMHLSPDIASILYSFNNLIEQQSFQSNLFKCYSG